MTEDVTAPPSDAQKMLKRMDDRDKTMRALMLALLIGFSILNVFTSVALHKSINDSQASTVEARFANLQRQQRLAAYTKCVFLIRYDSPPEAVVTRASAEKALDKCAAESLP